MYQGLLIFIQEIMTKQTATIVVMMTTVLHHEFYICMQYLYI